jgi:hypothetical protein
LDATSRTAEGVSMTTLIEKVNDIIENSDFNDLTFEERARICKYLSRMQILTIWQMLNKDEHLTTDAWRKKQLNWLKNCVELYQREYGIGE